MWEERFRQEIRLRLLALVLALALTWYALNPAPGPENHVRRNEQSPEEKRREEKLRARVGYGLGEMEAFVTKSSAAIVGDELEWPEVIDV